MMVMRTEINEVILICVSDLDLISRLHVGDECRRLQILLYSSRSQMITSARLFCLPSLRVWFVSIRVFMHNWIIC